MYEFWGLDVPLRTGVQVSSIVLIIVGGVLWARSDNYIKAAISAAIFMLGEIGAVVTSLIPGLFR